MLSLLVHNKKEDISALPFFVSSPRQLQLSGWEFSGAGVAEQRECGNRGHEVSAEKAGGHRLYLRVGTRHLTNVKGESDNAVKDRRSYRHDDAECFE